MATIEMIRMMFGAAIPAHVMQEMADEMERRKFEEIDINRCGNQLVLPVNMTLEEGVRFLNKKIDEAESECTIIEDFECFPLDGAHAFVTAVGEQFGFACQTAQEFETFFGKLRCPPQTVHLWTSPNTKVAIPWGVMTLPGIEGSVELTMRRKENRAILTIIANVKGKNREAINMLMTATRFALKERSVYKGKAIKIKFRDDKGQPVVFSPDVQPQFLDLTGVSDPIFTRSTDDQILFSIKSVIRKTDELRRRGIKLKRTVLLEGDFGCGKTLAAHMIAKDCVANGWTFLYVPTCEDLAAAYQIAGQYAPCVVFAEDADRVMKGERGFNLDALSYALDGADNKNVEIITLLTTNNVEGIARLMMRPGRIDAVVSIEKPDLDTAWRMINASCELDGTRGEFEVALEPIIGQNAAFVMEVGKKASLMAICAGSTITPRVIGVAVQSVMNHVRIMNAPVVGEKVLVELSDLQVQVPANAVINL